MKRMLLGALVAAVLFAPAFPVRAGQGGKPSDVPCDGLSTYMATLPIEPLSDAEKEGLLFTREEEKLARDVYVALAAKWGHRVFTNIAAAERKGSSQSKAVFASSSRRHIAMADSNSTVGPS